MNYSHDELQAESYKLWRVRTVSTVFFYLFILLRGRANTSRILKLLFHTVKKNGLDYKHYKRWRKITLLHELKIKASNMLVSRVTVAKLTIWNKLIILIRAAEDCQSLKHILGCVKVTESHWIGRVKQKDATLLQVLKDVVTNELE